MKYNKTLKKIMKSKLVFQGEKKEIRALCKMSTDRLSRSNQSMVDRLLNKTVDRQKQKDYVKLIRKLDKMDDCKREQEIHKLLENMFDGCIEITNNEFRTNYRIEFRCRECGKTGFARSLLRLFLNGGCGCRGT